MKLVFSNQICLDCILEIKNSFHYGIGSKEISKTKYDTIINRGYIISEELDEDRNE